MNQNCQPLFVKTKALLLYQKLFFGAFIIIFLLLLLYISFHMIIKSSYLKVISIIFINDN